MYGGGHVVDIMNRRISRPFSEDEVLKVCPQSIVC
jgi:hypothetical protein